MLSIFIVSFIFAITCSAFCSLMESILYSVPQSYIKSLVDHGYKSGKLLLNFKNKVSRPIAAILILNTIANTAGAAICGWSAGQLYGSNFVFIFSVIFTLSILYLSEIIPKLVGVIYSKELCRFIAYPLQIIVVVFTPLIALTEGVATMIQGKTKHKTTSLKEVISMSEIGEIEGTLDSLEGSVIRNIINLDAANVKSIMTPRVVMFRLDGNTSLGDLKNEILNWVYSRIPVYLPDNEELITGYVTQRDLYKIILSEDFDKDKEVKDFIRPIITIPELMRADKLLIEFIEKKEHIAAVVDEHGSLVGIITLEDIFEEIVGKEILDEYDQVRDLRIFARERSRNINKNNG